MEIESGEQAPSSSDPIERIVREVESFEEIFLVMFNYYLEGGLGCLLFLFVL